MLEFTGINYWAVMAVWLIYVVVGAFWYSPAGFAKLWVKYTGIDIMKMPQAEATRAIFWVAASALVQSLTLAVVINSLGIVEAVDGLVAGVLLWFGLTAATTVGVTLYSRRNWNFWWLNNSYFLIVMAVAGAIFAAWR